MVRCSIVRVGAGLRTDATEPETGRPRGAAAALAAAAIAVAEARLLADGGVAREPGLAGDRALHLRARAPRVVREGRGDHAGPRRDRLGGVDIALSCNATRVRDGIADGDTRGRGAGGVARL